MKDYKDNICFICLTRYKIMGYYPLKDSTSYECQLTGPANQIATGCAAVFSVRQLRLLTLCTGTPY